MCNICLTEKPKEEFKLTPCAHFSCKDCMDEILKVQGKCPECRMPIKKENIILLTE